MIEGYVQHSIYNYTVYMYAEDLISKVQTLRTMDKGQGQVFRGLVLNFIGIDGESGDQIS